MPLEMLDMNSTLRKYRELMSEFSQNESFHTNKLLEELNKEMSFMILGFSLLFLSVSTLLLVRIIILV